MAREHTTRRYEVTVRVTAGSETVHESTHALPPGSGGATTATVGYTTDEARDYVLRASTADGATETLDVGAVEGPCTDDCHCLGVVFEVHERAVNALVGHRGDCGRAPHQGSLFRSST